ncbi:calcium-dependent protein kinase 1-like [Durio zibethinus]|uniref:Calcium-dependent protein kinase 1-like n=1 Tax=Durio zibethinus TaxID=66656 RepID=A0A6P5Y763_DURZI|nr:calcium-dependent protein kinase 1-like [Durio zibethinus]
MPVAHMHEGRGRWGIKLLHETKRPIFPSAYDEEKLSCYLAFIYYPFYVQVCLVFTRLRFKLCLMLLSDSNYYLLRVRLCLGWLEPEVLLGNYSEKVDIWSAGVLPFQGDYLKEVFEAIKNVKLDFHSGLWESLSKPARDPLARMLTKDVFI